MTKDIRIRLALETDIVEILRLYEELLNEKTDLESAYTEFPILQKGHDNIYVAEINQHVVGTIQISICKSLAFGCRPAIAVDYLIVDPRFRHQGVGTRLMNTVDEVANKVNAESAFFVSSENRVLAHSFYRKIGYCENVMGFRKKYYGEKK